MDVTDGSLPRAHSLPLISSPNRCGRRFIPRAWTPRHWTTFRLSRAAPLPPSLSNPARFFLLDDADARATLPTPSLSHRTAPTPSVPSHLRREPRNTAATAISTRELLSGQFSLSHPPSSNCSHLDLPRDDTKPSRAFPGDFDASPSRSTSSSSAPTTGHRGQPASAVSFDDTQHCKLRHPPLLLTRALI